MTKTVRIENADANTYHKVRVRVEHKSHETGEWYDGKEARELSFPAQLAELGIHSHRRLIVEEFSAEVGA